MGLDPDTVAWRERFEDKNDKEHKGLNKQLTKLITNVALQTQAMETLKDSVEAHNTDAVKILKEHDDRLKCVESESAKRKTQLRTLNWVAILIAGIIAFANGAKELFSTIFKGG